MRLICMHHAGGSAAAFRPLIRALGAEAAGIAVTAVNLPGRESRVAEPRHQDITACAAQLVTELGGLLDEPYVLLGHSMGALIAYTMIQRRVADGLRVPEALIAVSCAAPHLPSPALGVESADDLELATALSRYGGLPPEILHRGDWLAALIPLVRDDLRICASYRYAGEPPLPCRIHVLGGDADPVVTADALAGWRRHSALPVAVTTVPGGHFILREPGAPLISLIGAVLLD